MCVCVYVCVCKTPLQISNEHVSPSSQTHTHTHTYTHTTPTHDPQINPSQLTPENVLQTSSSLPHQSAFFFSRNEFSIIRFLSRLIPPAGGAPLIAATNPSSWQRNQRQRRCNFSHFSPISKSFRRLIAAKVMRPLLVTSLPRIRRYWPDRVKEARAHTRAHTHTYRRIRLDGATDEPPVITERKVAHGAEKIASKPHHSVTWLMKIRPTTQSGEEAAINSIMAASGEGVRQTRAQPQQSRRTPN